MRKSILVTLKLSTRTGAVLTTLTLLGLVLAGCDAIFFKPLIADFAAFSTKGIAPLKVQFEDLSRYAHRRPIVSWEWDFGDGTKSTERHPTHTYTEPGKYTVGLTVVDGAGRTDTVTRPDYIVVTEASIECQVPEEYRAIQEAIDDPSCGTILVEGGTYEENLFIDRSLTLKGPAIIKADDERSPVILIAGDSDLIEVVVERVTIRGAWHSDGINILGEAKVVIQNSTILENAVGIFLSGSVRATIWGNTIIGNVLYGVVLYLRECGFLQAPPAFEGLVEGSSNRIEESRSDVCPPELGFLKTEEGGSYP